MDTAASSNQLLPDVADVPFPPTNPRPFSDARGSDSALALFLRIPRVGSRVASGGSRGCDVVRLVPLES